MDDGRSVHHRTRVLDRTRSLRFLDGSLDGATRVVVDSGCCRGEENGVRGCCDVVLFSASAVRHECGWLLVVVRCRVVPYRSGSFF
jgi:hypothetical protein